jgi:hypothetical protein
MTLCLSTVFSLKKSNIIIIKLTSGSPKIDFFSFLLSIQITTQTLMKFISKIPNPNPTLIVTFLN